MKHSMMKTNLMILLMLFNGCGREIGIPGPKGDKGDPGLNGVSCTVNEVVSSNEYPNGGAVITCGANVVVVKNGADGDDGEDGQPGANAVIQLIDPCGDYPSVHDEVILRLSTNQLLASFSDNPNGKNTRFAVITPGSYQTTDGTNCNFTVDLNGNVSW